MYIFKINLNNKYIFSIIIYSHIKIIITKISIFTLYNFRIFFFYYYQYVCGVHFGYYILIFHGNCRVVRVVKIQKGHQVSQQLLYDILVQVYSMIGTSIIVEQFRENIILDLRLHGVDCAVVARTVPVRTTLSQETFRKGSEKKRVRRRRTHSQIKRVSAKSSIIFAAAVPSNIIARRRWRYTLHTIFIYIYTRPYIYICYFFSEPLVVRIPSERTGTKKKTPKFQPKGSRMW